MKDVLSGGFQDSDLHEGVKFHTLQEAENVPLTTDFRTLHCGGIVVLHQMRVSLTNLFKLILKGEYRSLASNVVKNSARERLYVWSQLMLATRLHRPHEVLEPKKDCISYSCGNEGHGGQIAVREG